MKRLLSGCITKAYAIITRITKHMPTVYYVVVTVKWKHVLEAKCINKNKSDGGDDVSVSLMLNTRE
jgi:hypothetical protein